MTRPAYSFCVCPDSNLLRGRIQNLLSQHSPTQTGAASTWQRFVFWGDEGLSSSFWEHLTLQGLFAIPKALVIRNAQLLPAENLRRLFTAVSALAPSKGVKGSLPNPLIWPFICLEVAFEKGKAKIPAHIQKSETFQFAEKSGWTDYTPGLTPQTMPAFIRNEAARAGLSLRQEELALLSRALSPDAALISSELAKLALLTDKDGKLPPNAATFVEQGQELNIFELMRIIQQQGPAPVAWRRILEDKLSGENLVFAFNAILLREARILWQLLVGQSVYLPPNIASQKKMAAESLGLAGVARIWEIALKADKGIKSGERSPDQAFEMLASDLFMLFGRARRI